MTFQLNLCVQFTFHFVLTVSLSVSILPLLYLCVCVCTYWFCISVFLQTICLCVLVLHFCAFQYLFRVPLSLFFASFSYLFYVHYLCIYQLIIISYNFKSLDDCLGPTPTGAFDKLDSQYLDLTVYVLCCYLPSLSLSYPYASSPPLLLSLLPFLFLPSYLCTPSMCFDSQVTGVSGVNFGVSFSMPKYCIVRLPLCRPFVLHISVLPQLILQATHCKCTPHFQGLVSQTDGANFVRTCLGLREVELVCLPSLSVCLSVTYPLRHYCTKFGTG